MKVYKHLAEGAQQLGDPKEFTSVLEQSQEGKVLISFADEVVHEGEGDISVSEVDGGPIATGVEPADTAEAESDQEDETITPESQEQLSETIKEVAEKVKGAESTVAAESVEPVADSVVEEGEVKEAASQATTQSDAASEADHNRAEPLKDKPPAEIGAATPVRPEQQDMKQ